MKLSKKELEEEWVQFGDLKPWYCTECDALLSVEDFPECNGEDPLLPVEEQNPHPVIKADNPIEFNDFCKIMNRWFEPILNSENKTKTKSNKEE